MQAEWLLYKNYGKGLRPYSPKPGMYDNQRIIYLTEVSATDFLTSDNYKYKCRVQMSNEGQPLLQKDSFSRKQPSWLLDLKTRETVRSRLPYATGKETSLSPGRMRQR